jgi:hypothetical protein
MLPYIIDLILLIYSSAVSPIKLTVGSSFLLENTVNLLHCIAMYRYTTVTLDFFTFLRKNFPSF